MAPYACRTSGFTLHGLWPNLDNHCPDDFPEVCDSSDYDSSQISGTVLADMKSMWTSYISGEPHQSVFARQIPTITRANNITDGAQAARTWAQEALMRIHGIASSSCRWQKHMVLLKAR